MYTTCLKHKIFYFVHAVYLSISNDPKKNSYYIPNSINRMVVVMQTQCIFCEVQTESSNIIEMGSRLQVTK